ncbi:MAG: enoyl-CoA hydratase/isomerase family protein [Gemmatimonadaceae bacterium]
MSSVRISRDGAIGRLTLARPAKRNALDRAMADDLHAALQEMDANESVRAVSLAGDGPDFCAGADLAALEQMLDAGPEVHREDATALGGVFLQIRAMSKPVVALVTGRALAGGAGLATACDIVLAHEAARFGYPEVKVGFVPAMVLTMLRRCVGEKHAFDLVATGRTIDAREAERIGLVSRVFAAESFESDCEAVVEGLSRSPTMALAMTKRLFYDLDSMPFAQGVALGVTTNAAARATADFRDGVRRFVARPRVENER